MAQGITVEPVYVVIISLLTGAGGVIALLDGLIDMTPSLPADDFTDDALTDPVFVGQPALSGAAGVSGADFPHRILCQLGVGDALATRLTAFLYFVVVVIDLRSEEEMLDVDARRVVALMQNVKRVRDRAVCQFPGNAMREHFTSPGTSAVDDPVSCGMVGADPGNTPCRGRFAEMLLKGGGKGNARPQSLALPRTKAGLVLFESSQTGEKRPTANDAGKEPLGLLALAPAGARTEPAAAGPDFRSTPVKRLVAHDTDVGDLRRLALRHDRLLIRGGCAQGGSAAYDC